MSASELEKKDSLLKSVLNNFENIDEQLLDNNRQLSQELFSVVEEIEQTTNQKGLLNHYTS
jgi:hypothetical protein